MKPVPATRELYREDVYLREFEARVVRNSGREVVLDRTAFYPGGSGQPSDKGGLKVGPVNAKVIEVKRAETNYDGSDEPGDEDEDSEGGGDGSGKDGAGEDGAGGIVHVLDQAIPKTVRGVRATLDWPRRYRNMRYNTALALLSIVASRDLGAAPGVGRIRSSRARLDLTKPRIPLDDAAARGVESAVNGIISDGLDVQSDGGFVVAGLPRGVESGGLHVGNTREVGGISVTRYFDRGSRGVRMEITLTGEAETKAEDEEI